VIIHRGRQQLLVLGLRGGRGQGGLLVPVDSRRVVGHYLEGHDTLTRGRELYAPLYITICSREFPRNVQKHSFQKLGQSLPGEILILETEGIWPVLVLRSCAVASADLIVLRMRKYSYCARAAIL